MILSHIFAIILVLQQLVCCIALFQWMFGSNEHFTAGGFGAKSESSSKGASVPFEITSTDEKFLSHAAEYTNSDLSQLDLCHHKIIIGLKQSCMNLNEEEIAKLSVNLLNCQSYLEDRPIYPCTTAMALKDCTRNMDKDTWNAYHIISNRARAVCYSTRQIQFRAKTEMTINKLVTTAEEQLHAMSTLQDKQEKLGSITDDTFKTITMGHDNLLQQQQMLKSAQQHILYVATNNMRELMQEKALINAGQKELAMMTEAIKKKLDSAEAQLTNQEEGRRRNHLEVVNDLAKMQTRAKKIWENMDMSMQKIWRQQQEAALHHQQVLDNMQRVNDSINYLLQLVDQTRIEIDDRIHWFASIAKEMGVQMTVVWIVILHLVYFLFSAIAAAFVNAPSSTRLALLVLVPLNALCEVNNVQSLSFRDLTLTIASSAILHFACKYACTRRNTSRGIYSSSGDHGKHLEFSRVTRYRETSNGMFSDGSDGDSSFNEHGAVLPAEAMSSALWSLNYDPHKAEQPTTKVKPMESHRNKPLKSSASSSDETDRFGLRRPLNSMNDRVLRPRKFPSRSQNESHSSSP